MLSELRLRQFTDYLTINLRGVGLQRRYSFQQKLKYLAVAHGVIIPVIQLDLLCNGRCLRNFLRSELRNIMVADAGGGKRPLELEILRTSAAAAATGVLALAWLLIVAVGFASLSWSEI